MTKDRELTFLAGMLVLIIKSAKTLGWTRRKWMLQMGRAWDGAEAFTPYDD